MKHNRKLIESGITKIVKKVIREASGGPVDLRKVDRTNLSTTASNVLDLLIDMGCRGKYDAEQSAGTAEYRGYVIEFNTGAENFYFKLSNSRLDDLLSSKNPNRILPEIKRFLDAVSNYE